MGHSSVRYSEWSIAVINDWGTGVRQTCAYDIVKQ